MPYHVYRNLQRFSGGAADGDCFCDRNAASGFLGWGLSVINGGKSSSSTETEAETDEAETLEVSTGDDKNTVRVVKPDGTVMEIDVSDLPSAQENESGGQTQTETTVPAVPKVSFGEKFEKFRGKQKCFIGNEQSNPGIHY